MSRGKREGLIKDDLRRVGEDWGNDSREARGGGRLGERGVVGAESKGGGVGGEEGGVRRVGDEGWGGRGGGRGGGGWWGGEGRRGKWGEWELKEE